MIRRALTLLIVLLPVVFQPAMADTLSISPRAASSARDGGAPGSPSIDGQFDALIGGSILSVSRNHGPRFQTETRAAYEFVLPPALLLPGVTIDNVTLTVPVAFELLLGGNTTITAHGYRANSSLTVDDFEVSNPIASRTISPGRPVSGRSFDVTSWLQTLPIPPNRRIGFVFAADTWGTNLLWRDAATLTVQYTVRAGTAPTLQIGSPHDGAIYLLNEYFFLQADALDAEDGSLGPTIQWQSSIDGLIAAGGFVFMPGNVLSPGTHLITATAVDSDGNSASHTITIHISPLENQPPDVTITSPVPDQFILAGTTTHFIATAHDPETGSLDQEIHWRVDGEIVGTGPDVPVVLSLGKHHVSVHVTDGFWFFESQMAVTVVTELPPPPPTG